MPTSWLSALCWYLMFCKELTSAVLADTGFFFLLFKDFFKVPMTLSEVVFADVERRPSEVFHSRRLEKSSGVLSLNLVKIMSTRLHICFSSSSSSPLPSSSSLPPSLSPSLPPPHIFCVSLSNFLSQVDSWQRESGRGRERKNPGQFSSVV